MDVVEATNDFQDWELLQTSSDSESAPVSPPDHSNSFDEIDSGGLIQADYFSLDSENRYGLHVLDGGFDNPGWIDPGFGDDPTQLYDKEPGEFWPDSRSADRKFRELEDEDELGPNENEEKEVKFGTIEGQSGEAEDLESYCMDSSVIAGDSVEVGDLGDNSEVGVEGNVNSHVELGGGGVVDGEERKNSCELGKRGIVWWKMPMEFLKHCLIKMSPVWTVSVAAAFLGFLILGRRLYKMKRRTRGLEIKVAVDDKKASQVMSRAARLNEAFTVVKLVPVIRPSLPAVGSTSNWPVMSLR